MYRDCNDLQPAAPVQYTLDVLVAPPAYCACVEDKTVFLILNSDRSSDVLYLGHLKNLLSGNRKFVADHNFITKLVLYNCRGQAERS